MKVLNSFSQILLSFKCQKDWNLNVICWMASLFKSIEQKSQNDKFDDMEPIYNPKLYEQNSTGCMKNNEKKTITKKNQLFLSRPFSYRFHFSDCLLSWKLFCSFSVFSHFPALFCLGCWIVFNLQGISFVMWIY